MICNKVIFQFNCDNVTFQLYLPVTSWDDIILKTFIILHTGAPEETSYVLYVPHLRQDIHDQTEVGLPY